jgi:hypothetical protein
MVGIVDIIYSRLLKDVAVEVDDIDTRLAAGLRPAREEEAEGAVTR